MNGASKILTVSYGTFSCTLEGFDDPFNTMKAIAEYFRDLAAEDRYFGAEPPTPDAAMLHRIAEREIQRRVEAKVQENGVVLRASDLAGTAAPPAVSAPQMAPVAQAPMAEAAAAQPNLAQPSLAQPSLAQPMSVPAKVEPAVAAPGLPAAESVVERLSRLRSEVAAQPATPAPEATATIATLVLPDYAEDEEPTAPTIDRMDFLPEDLAPSDGDTLPEEAPADPGTATVALEQAADIDLSIEAIEEEPATLPAEAADVLPKDLAPSDSDTLPEEAETAPTAEAVADIATADGLIEAVADAVMTQTAEAPEATAAPVEDATAESQPMTLEAMALGAGNDVFSDDELAEVDLPEGLAMSLAAAQSPDGGATAEGADEAEPPTAPKSFAAETAVTAMAGDAEDDLHASIEAVLAQSDLPDSTAERPDAALTDADAGPEKAEGAVEAEFGQGMAPQAEAASAIEMEIAELRVETRAPAATTTGTQDDTQDRAPEAADAASSAELRPGAAEKLMRARARVVRIRRGDMPEPDATPAQSAPATAPAAPVATSAAPAQPVADFPDLDKMGDVELILSPEDEAELQRELAALRGGASEERGPDEADRAITMPAGRGDPAQAEPRRSFEGPSADEAVGRLMQQTDSEMEGSEAKRRLSAIQHLRAAVAATVAERKVTGEQTQEAEKVSRLARYRNDLAMVVKSALPGAARGNESAPAERPAPLVLVSEQRIDRPRPTAMPASAQPVPAMAQQGGAVRPRRVTSASLALQAEDMDEDDEGGPDDVANMFGNGEGFAEFVERVGATSLEQILEASAAYMSGVEGRPHFSRPQLMRHLGAVVPPGAFQREDGLRGFGALLRDGRIAKVRRGQFVLSEESAYLAEARRIAG